MPLEFKVFIDDEDLPLYEKSKQSDVLYEWEAMVQSFHLHLDKRQI